MSVSILAGPIVRRAEKRRVCIWLATDQATEIEGFVYPESDTDTPIGRAVAAENGAPSSVQLGERFHIHLLQLRPVEAEHFPLDRVLLYDLSVDGKSLSGHRLIDGARGVNYPGLPLPSFMIPAELRNVLFGSCRKPHAEAADERYGIYDQLATGDALLARNPRSRIKRPTHLVLTGDQIYADDVAGPLLAHVAEKAVALTGRREALPVGARRGRVKPAELDLYGRKQFFDDHRPGLSSGNDENHLMSFGEYCAMYLAVWGGRPITYSSPDDVAPRLAPDSYSVDEDDNFGTMYAAWYDQELKRLRGFNRTLANVRRLLANASTLMLCDDHDVTDDWNIRKDWEDDVYGNALGRRIVANALAAYWAFQGWGNDPERYDADFIADLRRHLLAGSVRGQKAERFESRLLSTDWLYSVPTSPPILALDTRTQRKSDDRRGPARLIGPKGLQRVAEHYDTHVRPHVEGYADPSPVIMVSPTPVFGFQRVEFLQRKAFDFLGLVPVETLDFESWSGNERGLAGLVYTIHDRIGASWVVFLSGDVHYSFTKRYARGVEGLPFDAYQLTSSPLSNAPTAKFVFRRLKEIDTHRKKYRYLLPVSPGNSKQYVLDQNNIGQLVLENGKPHHASYWYTDKRGVLQKFQFNLTGTL